MLGGKHLPFAPHPKEVGQPQAKNAKRRPVRSGAASWVLTAQNRFHRGKTIKPLYLLIVARATLGLPGLWDNAAF
jgi:hypothetical protein